MKTENQRGWLFVLPVLLLVAFNALVPLMTVVNYSVQETFGKVFNEGTEFQRDGSQFDALFQDGDTYMVGSMPCFAMHTPGHTP
ncbi:MAG: hypothetical protein AAGK82_10110, partial [Pseudomonadota bacterium]